MKNIKSIIFEKILINKNTQIHKEEEFHAGDIDSYIKDYISNMIIGSSSTNTLKLHAKVKSFQSNPNKNPNDIIKSVKNLETLYILWWSAIHSMWDDGIKIIANEIVNKDKKVTKMNLHNYVFYRYKLFKNHNSFCESYEHYFELYNIKTEN